MVVVAYADNAAVFLDADQRVVPRHNVDVLSALSRASLESLASAAVFELTASSTHTFGTQDVAEQHTSSDNEAFVAMCALISVCARNGSARSSAEQQQQLYALGVEDEDLQMKLIPVLTTVVPSVRRVLESTYFDFAQVVDVSWRLDYVLQSSDAGSVREPLYFVQLQLQSPRAGDSGLETAEFTCSMEELRALVYRIQEAVNEVEKLVAGAPSQLKTSACEMK